MKHVMECLEGVLPQLGSPLLFPVRRRRAYAGLWNLKHQILYLRWVR